jgi:hypothetical protein
MSMPLVPPPNVQWLDSDPDFVSQLSSQILERQDSCGLDRVAYPPDMEKKPHYFDATR